MLKANAEHKEMMVAILSGDAVLAREHGERHGRSGRARFLKAIAYLTPGRSRDAKDVSR